MVDSRFAVQSTSKSVCLVTRAELGRGVDSETMVFHVARHGNTKTYKSCKQRLVTVRTEKKSQFQSVPASRLRTPSRQSQVRSGPG